MNNFENAGMPEWLAKLVAIFGYSFVAAAVILLFIMYVIIMCRIAIKIGDKLYSRSCHRENIKAWEAKHGKPYHS